MNPKVILAQRGARHRYTVAKIFNDHGLLHQLITDSHSHSKLGNVSKFKILRKFCPRLNKLQGRNLFAQGINKEKTVCVDSWAVIEKLFDLFFNKKYGLKLKWREVAWYWMIRKKVNFLDSNILYTMYTENYHLLLEAKKHNVKIVLDCIIDPMSTRIVKEEKQKFNIKLSGDENDIDCIEKRCKEIFDLADIILCPSRVVADGVLKIDKNYESRICICPYGSSLEITNGKRDPVERRIFWAGGEWLRKGLHYLAEAGQLLNVGDKKYEIRVAGIDDVGIINDKRFQGVTFLGKLNRQEMEHEMSKADAFVFPTISEGMAGVVIEALGMGCPVITTHAAGVDCIENGKSGIIIENLNAESIAYEIKKLCADRALIQKMSDESIVLAENFSFSSWSERLVNVMENLTL